MYSLTDIFATGLLLFVVTVTFVGSVDKNTPAMCNQTEPWKLGGRDIIADSKGFVLLVALMPVHCEHCHKQLMKFQAVSETLPGIRVVVVAPYDENPRLIEWYREEFPRVAIGMESVDERVWKALSGSAHDHFIYDRCGRLASVIRHPKSDTTRFEDTVRALKLAVNYAQCGWCEYDPPDLPSPQKPILPLSSPYTRTNKLKTPCEEEDEEWQRIKAVVHPSTALADSKIYPTDRRQPSGSADERSYLRTNTVAPVHRTHSRTSSSYTPSATTAKVSSTLTKNYQRLKDTSSELQQQQQRRIPQQEEQTLQPRRFGISQQQQNQRHIVIQPDKDLPKAVNWRTSKEWAASRQFLSRTRQRGNQQRERAREQERQQQRQEDEERRYHEEERRREQEQERERIKQEQERERIKQEQERERITQEQQKRIREQQEEQRRNQEQQRWQEEQQRNLLEQQRLQQQEQERIEEHRRLQKQQRTESELYPDDDDDRSDHEKQWKLTETQQRQQQQQQIQRAQSSGTTTRAPFGLGGPVAKMPSLYDFAEEEGDYDYTWTIDEATTTTTTTASPAVRTQIPGTEPPGAWPTPFLFEQQVPCAAFTDEVCLQQKKKMDNGKMNKCCDKGIYLTDLCMPGRCTKATTELCCMQKFLQSKFKCCSNDSEAINSPGDAFSRCCYNNFVQDDDKCCPAERAKFHWSSAHEVCLPNVRVDLSGLRFSVHTAASGNGDGTAGNGAASALGQVIMIDLNEDRSWDHVCHQGADVLQFPYLPGDEVVDTENADESK